MKTNIILPAAMTSALLVSVSVDAAVQVPHQFAPGTKAVASEVNDNFKAVADGVNANAADITQLQSDLTDLESKIPVSTPGSGTASNASALPALGALLNMEETANHFPAYALNRQSCTSNKISASATVGGINLAVTGLLGEEGLSQSYRFAITGTSSSDVSLTSLTGGPASLTIFGAGGNRIVTGIVTRAAKSYTRDGAVQYSITIEPTISRLKLANDYSVYQNLPAPDIIQSVLQPEGIISTQQIVGSYDPLEMKVMYNQSPFSFIQRLAEENAIAYYFNGDSPVFFDDSSAYPASTLNLTYDGLDAPLSQSTPSAISFFQAVRQSADLHSANGFSLTQPDADLSSTQGAGSIEQYRFRQHYTSLAQTQQAAQNSLSRAESRSSRHYGASNSALLTPGYTFTLSATGSAILLSGSYVPTAIRHVMAKSADGKCMIYANSFSSLPASTFDAPALRTPAAIAYGGASATVTGPAGETRHTDEYGRIKIQFHWDRNGSNDDTSSAWVRVATPVNRLDDKHLYIPPIGSEVLVSFLDGDPSLPVVTGSLYNANTPPPVTLPAGKGAADSSPYNRYDYFAYTAGGTDNSLIQSAFKTVRSELVLDSNGCRFVSDQTYLLDQNASSSASSVIVQSVSDTQGKFTPVCDGFNVVDNVITVSIDGVAYDFLMDDEWNTGMATVTPPATAKTERYLGFIYLVRKP